MSVRRIDIEEDHRPSVPYLAIAAHELRTPATVMVGAADTLTRIVDPEQLGPVGAELIASLERNGRRLRRLITDLLCAAYLEQGELALKPGLLPLEPLLGWAADAAGASRHLVSIHCDPELHAYVDPDRFEQVVANLIGNAAGHGAPPIVVTATPVGRGERVEVVVRDHGAGVAAEQEARLFERFSALASHNDASTGLGLSIARDLARAMAGDVSYRREDPGSSFVVELPAGPPAA